MDQKNKYGQKTIDFIVKFIKEMPNTADNDFIRIESAIKTHRLYEQDEVSHDDAVDYICSEYIHKYDRDRILKALGVTDYETENEELNHLELNMLNDTIDGEFTLRLFNKLVKAYGFSYRIEEQLLPEAKELIKRY